jgi:CRISPR-associated protein (TIGR03984 family)
VEHGLRFLLAHCDDGVVWGRFDEGSHSLVTSDAAAEGHTEAMKVCPPLRLDTLQQARAFGPDAELLIWRVEEGRWKARLISDSEKQHENTEWGEAFDEPQLLWGTKAEPLDHGFTLLTEGASGLRHAVPLEHKGSSQAQILVRHYLTKNGFARVEASRLTALEWR